MMAAAAGNSADHSTANAVREQSEERLHIVSFRMGSEEFGVDILQVREIIRMTTITRVPNAPGIVEGVINLRGKVVPVVELRRKLGMPYVEPDKNTRIVIVELEEKTVGFIVDAVSEVLRIPQNVIEPPPSIAAGINAEFITAVGKLEDRLLILLDLKKTLSLPEADALRAM